MMRKSAIAFILLGLAATSWGLSSLKLDAGLSTSGVQPGWVPFLDTDSGTTLFDGIQVTVATTAGSPSYRNRTNVEYLGLEEEYLWRDFVFAAAGNDLVITIEGLKPSIKYELSVGAFDYESRTNTPRAADWKVVGVTILTTSFGVPGVPLATMMPSAEWNYMKSGTAYSDATGKIVMQSSMAATHSTPTAAHAFVNGLIVNPALWTYDPAPSDGLAGVALNPTLTWYTGPDPNDFGSPNPKIGMHYLYFTDEPNFINTAPISISAGTLGNPNPTGSWGPLSLNYDKTYIWRVDEGVYVGGVISGPDDPATITGKVWSFDTLKSVPVINNETLPGNLKVSAGETAQFVVEYSSLSPAMVTWYKDGQAIIPDSRVTIDTTEDASTLSIDNAGLGDEGGYVCEIVNAGGSDETDPIYLAIARLLAHYKFEQDGDDAVGVNDGTAINGMEYAAGIVTDEGQAWAADPNGTNYFVLPQATAYPRAGYGKGLEESTYSYWVKRGTYTGNGRILGNFNDSNNTAIQLNVTGTGALGWYVRQEGNIYRELNTPADIISEDQWHHVAFTFDSSRVYCYVDGRARYYIDAFPMSNFVEWQYPMTLLARNVRSVVGENYRGEIDDLRIYNYAKDREGIAQLYYDVTNIRPCLYGNPEFDVSGPEGEADCVVDIYDFAEFARAWLESGLFVPEN